MDTLDAHATVGNFSQKQTFDIETDSHRPIITPHEARKVLGSEYKNFSDERLEKLEAIINTKRSELNAEIEKLERQRTIFEKSIDRLIGFMGEPARLWGKADLPTRQLLQQLVFPNGIKCSPKEKIFGTDEISPLYSVISNKKRV